MKCHTMHICSIAAARIGSQCCLLWNSCLPLFSEPQFGKDVCDRILCPMKGAIRRYCNEGHDILSARDMHSALRERPVKGSTAAVCEINETVKDLEITKIQGMSAFHNFKYESNGLRVWKAFGVGPGKVLPWRDIYRRHQSATHLTVADGYQFFPALSRTIKVDSRAPQPTESGDPNLAALIFECPDPSCSAAFTNIESVELHSCLERHSVADVRQVQEKDEGIFDKLRRDWVERFASLTIDSSSVREDASISSQSTEKESRALLSTGWALQSIRSSSL